MGLLNLLLLLVLAGVQVACCAVARLAHFVMEDPPLLAAYLRAPLSSFF
jgi:hypothetical protein